MQIHGVVVRLASSCNVTMLLSTSAAAFADSFPLGVDQSSSGTFRYGETDFRASKAIRVSHYDISPGYFRAIGTRLLAGRDFTWHDDAKSPLTAIVNQTFARKVLGNQNGVGLYYRVGDLKQPPVQVIGIVEDMVDRWRTTARLSMPALWQAHGIAL